MTARERKGKGAEGEMMGGLKGHFKVLRCI